MEWWWEHSWRTHGNEKRQRWITFIQYTSCRNIIHPTNNHNAGKNSPLPQSVEDDRIEIVGGGLSQCSPSRLYWKTVRVKLGTEISYWSILSLKPMGLSHHTCSFSHSLFFQRSPIASFNRCFELLHVFTCWCSSFYFPHRTEEQVTLKWQPDNNVISTGKIDI